MQNPTRMTETSKQNEWTIFLSRHQRRRKSPGLQLQGGGIIFFARNPHHPDHVYFLLGREKYNPDWNRSSERWCGFSGSADRGEDVADVCAREAVEELVGINMLERNNATGGPTAGKWLSRDRLSGQLLRGDFAFLLAMYRMPYGSRAARQIYAARHRAVHFTIFREIPWQIDIISRFRTIRAGLAHLHRLSEDYRKAKKSLSSWESTYLPGTSLGIEMQSCILFEQEVLLIGRFLSSPPHPNSVLNSLTDPAVSPMAPVRSGSLYCRGPYGSHGSCSPGKEQDVYMKRFNTGRRLQRAFSCFQRLRAAWKTYQEGLENHPALTLTINDRGQFQNLMVDSVYLEKDDIAWWSVPLLRRVLGSGGIYKGERFRQCFLPALKVALDLIESGAGGDPNNRQYLHIHAKLRKEEGEHESRRHYYTHCDRTGPFAAVTGCPGRADHPGHFLQWKAHMGK